MPEERVTIEGGVVGETAAAWLFDNGDREAWLPKSRCEWDPDAGEMTLPFWLANAEELI